MISLSAGSSSEYGLRSFRKGSVVGYSFHFLQLYFHPFGHRNPVPPLDLTLKVSERFINDHTDLHRSTPV